MSTWKNRFINRALAPYSTKQRYKYQLFNYMKEVGEKQNELEKLIDDEPESLNYLVS